MNSRFLKELDKRVLILDGATGSMIQKYNLTEEDWGGKHGCNEYLILSRPDIMEEIHQSYLQAGCDVLETNSFGGSRPKLAEYGLEDKLYDINFKAVSTARKMADTFSTSDKPRFVVASIGPTGYLPSSNDPELGKISFDELTAIFLEQVKPLCEGGADALLIETSQDILEIKACVSAINQYFADNDTRIPIIAQVTLDTTGRMLLGTDIAAALTTIEAMGVDVVGMNCSTGPEHMRASVIHLCENTNLKVSVVPNAGLPINVDGQAVYELSPDDFAKQLVDFVQDFGVNIVGGCCGTTPEHIKRLTETVGSIPPKPRAVNKSRHVSSSMKALPLEQDPKPMLIGERLNAQGSRKVKELLLAEDYNGLLGIARDQIDSGAHVLDVSVAVTEKANEAEAIAKLMKLLSMSVEAPIMIDSTDYKTIETALKNYPGSAIINSINLENGRERVDHVLPLAKQHGACVVALTIDENGMAKTVDEKIEVAKKIYHIYVNEYQLDPAGLIFDLLTFTLATGEDEYKESAIETLIAIRELKEHLPQVSTVLGVSNVSFGLKTNARKVLNSVFLYHAVQQGLDLAIINPKAVIPYPSISENEVELAENLIYNRTDNPLQEFINYFEDRGSSQESLEKLEQTLPVEEAIQHKILHRRAEGIENLIDQAREKYSPIEILNDILLKAMKEVGEKFESGELILPFVLQSAETMRMAVQYLEQFMDKKQGQAKATVLLATVYGDVHDIGKNLVRTILTNNGYEVHDLGKQVPVKTIIEKAVELNVDAIGLSALLVSTSKQMEFCIQELHKQGYNFPVMVGGAAVNRNYGQKIALMENETIYEGGVFYAKDAFDGLRLMDIICNEDEKKQYIDNLKEEIKQSELQTPVASPAENKPLPRSDVEELEELPEPPYWGIKILTGQNLVKKGFAKINHNELFRLSWGALGLKKAEYHITLKDDFLPILKDLKKEILEYNIFVPKLLTAYFPCQTDGEKLILFDPQDHDKPIEELTFPRQNKAPYLCIADYFAGKSSGKKDLFTLQVVTLGNKAVQICESLEKDINYTKSYFLNGLASQTAEALAAFNHERILKELNLPEDQGRRYSFGYPSCPDLSLQQKLLKLVYAEQELGITLTPANQMIPEYSTAAFIVPHPEAVYFRL